MSYTTNQTEMRNALDIMYTDQGSGFAAGYMTIMVQEMLELLPKKKQKEFLAQVKEYNDRQLVTVKNILTGQEVEIRRGDLGTCCDPSMELYHSM